MQANIGIELDRDWWRDQIHSNRPISDLQAKRDKGETGDLFSVIKDSNGKDTLIALRKNSEAEVVDPAKYNVKTAQEALNVEKGVADIVAPTLLLAGELDRVVPSSVTLSMADCIRGADAVLLSTIGHVAAMQAPEVLAQHIVRFLKPRNSAIEPDCSPMN